MSTDPELQLLDILYAAQDIIIQACTDAAARGHKVITHEERRTVIAANAHPDDAPAEQIPVHSFHVWGEASQ